jgi:hypothetical protein
MMKGKEPSSAEIKSEAVHEEVHKEQAPVKSFGALKKRHWERHLAAGLHGKQKERTQSNDGSRVKLAAARRGGGMA